MKDKIEVTANSSIYIPKQTYRRRSTKSPYIYYEFKIQSHLLNNADDYEEFEKICDEYVTELDGKLE